MIFIGFMIGEGIFYNKLHLFSTLEYTQLDKQLDSLDAVLTVLEERRDHLHEEVVKLLLEARQVREEQERERQLEEEAKKTDKNNDTKSSQSDNKQ